MIEVKDIILVEELIDKMKKENFECEYEISSPVIATKDYFDSETNKIKSVNVLEQNITIKMHKNIIKKS